ncbi:MAG: hypothetical protein O3A00_21470, partial [Planctomycetota bacterium]|nr:hypothetical protein [Planctomycetota bacterium]
THKRPGTELCPRPYGQRLTHKTHNSWTIGLASCRSHKLHNFGAVAGGGLHMSSNTISCSLVGYNIEDNTIFVDMAAVEADHDGGASSVSMNRAVNLYLEFEVHWFADDAPTV